MAFLREENTWPEAIYRIERSDPLMGGEYGINNVQARQLACRTVYLLARILAEHDVDGSHFLTEKAISETAAIIESKLALDFSTAPLASEISNLAEILKNGIASLELIPGIENSLYAPLYEALKISWKYGYPRCGFEFFTNIFTLRENFREIEIEETITGDDSIDVVDSSSLSQGDYRILWDKEEGRSYFVKIKKVLTTKRVLLGHDEAFTRKNRGILTGMSWTPSPTGMFAKEGSKYISGKVGFLSGIYGGKLVIAHNSEASFTVEILRDGNSVWQPLPLLTSQKSESSGLHKSVAHT